MRPVTVVSGPEVMDKFVGSSEKNLREIFDNPPDIYPEAATMLGNNGGWQWRRFDVVQGVLDFGPGSVGVGEL